MLTLSVWQVPTHNLINKTKNMIKKTTEWMWDKAFAIHIVSSRFFSYDKRGVRAFVRYQTGNGCWAVELYRKKTKEESEGDHDWKMIRIGHINSYYTRKEAEIKALELCAETCKEYGY
jgi:hypothetical protein